MISSDLWQANQDLIIACLEHPFVQGIAQGTLPRNSFAFYVGQDAFFLRSFARAYSIAAAKAPDWEGFQLFHYLANGVLEELQLHQNYAQMWEINLQTTQPGVATRRYTEFLLTTAWSRDIGAIAAAMTPCMRLYAFLGQKLAQPEIPNHQYTDWIKTYSGDEFEQLTQKLEDLTNRYSVDESQAHTIYRYAMLCEQEFFQSAWEQSQTIA
ncbi:TenA family protein [Lyngbya sp. PCC 8106]|uniref:TenA family protein n=1 Tax=Lyngbya sp. (strain PCC 8106) TaxID=313612 RepID=UPI0000EA9D95|nr:TenA family protein [Lyngbya sp. PCC 8106]EAW38906.1 Transcriptional activator, TenA family protein [Lyngbya sp. PCC 8106]